MEEIGGIRIQEHYFSSSTMLIVTQKKSKLEKRAQLSQGNKNHIPLPFPYSTQTLQDMEIRVGQKMKSELKEAPCLTSLSPLQMQIKIHTHTHTQGMFLLPSCMYTYNPYVFGSNFPYFLKNLHSAGLFQFQIDVGNPAQPSTCQILSTFSSHRKDSEKIQTNQEKKLSLTSVLKSPLLPPQNKTVSQTCSCVKHYPPSSFFRTLRLLSCLQDWHTTSDRQMTLRRATHLKSIFYSA